MRTLIFTGKGGVGKTSVAAATALAAADQGLRTLIMSTDPAHSLADSLDTDSLFGHDPVRVTPHLDALEVSIYHDIDSNWGTVRQHFAELMASQGVDGMLADEMSILPGMEEAFPLIRIKKHKELNNYDLLVIDCAPTGETLRLLAAPDTFKWAIGMLRGAERFVVAPILRPMAKVSPGRFGKMVPDAKVYETIDTMFREMEGVSQLLRQPHETSVRLVMNPEKMVIKESQRALTYLSMYGLTVDTVVVNKILPLDQDSGYLNHWKGIQQRYLEDVNHAFAPLPIHRVPYYAEEVVGIEKLRQMGIDIYGDTNPAAVLYDKSPLEISKQNGTYNVRLKLPFADVEQLNLFQNGDELVIQIGDFRRTMTLPTSLAGLSAGQAEMHDEWLVVPFH